MAIEPVPHRVKHAELHAAGALVALGFLISAILGLVRRRREADGSLTPSSG
jgi:hypothetical protein